MTVGGKTSGNAKSGIQIAVSGDWLLASHHAKGVPKIANIIVVKPASRIEVLSVIRSCSITYSCTNAA